MRGRGNANGGTANRGTFWAIVIIFPNVSLRPRPRTIPRSLDHIDVAAASRGKRHRFCFGWRRQYLLKTEQKKKKQRQNTRSPRGNVVSHNDRKQKKTPVNTLYASVIVRSSGGPVSTRTSVFTVLAGPSVLHETIGSPELGTRGRP